MTQRVRVFLATSAVAFVAHLAVVYLWTGEAPAWPTPLLLFRASVIAVAIGAATAVALSRQRGGQC